MRGGSPAAHTRDTGAIGLRLGGFARQDPRRPLGSVAPVSRCPREYGSRSRQPLSRLGGRQACALVLESPGIVHQGGWCMSSKGAPVLRESGTDTGRRRTTYWRRVRPHSTSSPVPTCAEASLDYTPRCPAGVAPAHGRGSRHRSSRPRGATPDGCSGRRSGEGWPSAADQPWQSQLRFGLCTPLLRPATAAEGRHQVPQVSRSSNSSDDPSPVGRQGEMTSGSSRLGSPETVSVAALPQRTDELGSHVPHHP